MYLKSIFKKGLDHFRSLELLQCDGLKLIKVLFAQKANKIGIRKSVDLLPVVTGTV